MTAAIEILGQSCLLGDLLGAGGMGRVYAVHHPTRTVVVKLLREVLAGDRTMIERLAAEADAGRRVSHRNVVRVLESGRTAGGEPFVVMERVAGIPLGVLIQQQGPLPLARIRSIASQLLAGLAAIHRAGLVHADVKSDNVLVETTPAGDRVTIIDFGLARASAARAIAGDDRMVSGTPEYMAPEQVCGEPLTAAADLYGAGIILYEMLTGTTPFGGGTTSMIFERQLTEAPVAPSLRCPDRRIPAVLDEAILRALEKDPAARHEDASMFAAAVELAVPARCAERAAAHARVAFSTTAPTCDWVRSHELPHPRRRLAEGTAPRDSAPVKRRRDELEHAVATRDPDAIAVAALSLAQCLIEAHRLGAAARELEAVAEWLAGEHDAPEAAWRLQLTLAALYDGLHDPARARRAALDAREAAERAASATGLARTGALLRRVGAVARHR
jgi:serine/threonine-protein kinase